MCATTSRQWVNDVQLDFSYIWKFFNFYVSDSTATFDVVIANASSTVFQGIAKGCIAATNHTVVAFINGFGMISRGLGNN